MEYPVYENYFIDQDNLVLNMDKWGNGTPLFITGTSGDGKTTLAKKMAAEHNALLISTDVILMRVSATPERFAREDPKLADEVSMKYINSHPNIPYGASFKSTNKENKKILHAEILKFLAWTLSEIKTNPKYRNRKIIIEGCDISLLGPDFLYTQPIIILGCSRFTAFTRRFKRNQDEHPGRSAFTTLIKLLRGYALYGHSLDVEKERLRKGIEYYL